MNIQRETTISTLDETCELMCGGVEDDYDEVNCYNEHNEFLFKGKVSKEMRKRWKND